MAQPEGQRLQGLVQAYASTDHQRNPGYGCVLSALAGELKHQNEPVRLALEGRLQQFLALISDMADADHLQVDARAVLALMTGAVALSRLPGDAASAQGFLQAAVASLGTLATPRTSPP
jgi:hypothetical protein